MHQSSVTHSFATGSVTGNGGVGGLAGAVIQSVVSDSMALNEFVNGTLNFYRDFGMFGVGDNTLTNISAWENTSVNFVPREGVTEAVPPPPAINSPDTVDVSSIEVWSTFPVDPVWAASGFGADWVLNSYGRFLLPVHTWSVDLIFPGKAFVVADATHLIPGYSITYNGNEHTAGSVPVDSNRYALNEVATILGPGTLEKTGYIFIGWKTGAGVTPEEFFQPGDTRIMTTSVVLFAQWENTSTNGGNGNGGGGNGGGGGRPTGNATIVGGATVVEAVPSAPYVGYEYVGYEYADPVKEVMAIVLLFAAAVAIFAYRRVEETKDEA